MKQLLITIAAVLVVGCGNAEADRALLDAAEKGNIRAVKQHLAAGADVNRKVSDGSFNALDWAVSKGHKDVVELLITEGADVNAKCDIGWTPLHLAAQEGHKEIAELLIAKGVDVNAKTVGEWTPMHSAASKGQKEIVELLIVEGADVNEMSFGNTPLYWATHYKYSEVVDLLRKHGAKTSEELKAEGR